MCLQLELQQLCTEGVLLQDPPGLTGLAHTNCSPPHSKLLPHAKVHEVWLAVQLLKDDVLSLPLVQ